jgi:hypothetical protein
MPYSIAKIPKPEGGYRILHIPDENLKNEQRDILYNQLAMIKYPNVKTTIILGQHECSPHGLLSKINNTPLPVEKDVFLTECDIKDFFMNVTPDYLLPVFSKIKTIDFEKIVEKCFVEYKGKLVLPQGAPTSPRLAVIALYRLFKMIDSIFRQELDNVKIVNYIDNFYMFHSNQNSSKKLITIILNYGFKLSKFKCRRIPFKNENKPFVKMLGFTLYRDDNGKIVAKLRQKHKHTIRGLKHHLEKNYSSDLHKKLMGYQSWENIIKIINE